MLTLTLLIFFIGVSFWKTPSRKIYAIPLNNESADSDDDFLPPVPKKGKRKLVEKDVINKTLLNSISSIQSTVDEIMSVTKDSKLPLGMKKAMSDCFKCSICTGATKPPVIVMKCCNSLLGCEKCANGWFSGEEALTKTCPKCRSPRGYNSIMILRGFDSLLEVFSKIESEGDEEN